MPNLPDFPGKDLLEGSTRRAGAIVGAAAGGALAVGGFLAKKVLHLGDEDGRPEPGLAATDVGPTGTGAGLTTAPDGVPPVVPTGEGRRTATKPRPAPIPRTAKPAPAPAPKAAKPKPAPIPKVGKTEPAKPKPAQAKTEKPPAVKPKPANAKTEKPKAARSKPPTAKPKPAKSKPPAAKPKAAKAKAAATPKVDPEEPPATTGTDAPTVPGAEPGDQRGGKDPHHALNNPVTDPDETEYPDPYDKREDPRDPVDPDDAPFGAEPHPPTGAASTSEPPPSQDPEVGDRARPPRRENLDD